MIILLFALLTISKSSHAQFRPWVNNRYFKKVIMTSSGTFTIPAGAHRAYIRLWGAGGGAGGSVNGASGGTGGGGGYASGDFAVSMLKSQNLNYVFIGGKGSGGPTTTASGTPVGKGASGGSGTYLVTSTSYQMPALIAGGGAGGGGASGAYGGAGGAGGFDSAGDGSSCPSSNCSPGGSGAKGGLSTGTFTPGQPGNNVVACSLLGAFYITLNATAGTTSSDTSYNTEGGNGGTCYYNGNKGTVSGNGSSFYDTTSNTTGCSGGAGGGGRSGGGGSGLVVNAGKGCGGGGGGAGYFRVQSGATFHAGATGNGAAPALTTDPDLNVTTIVSGSVVTKRYATGGQPADFSGPANGYGGDGAGGLAVIYFY